MLDVAIIGGGLCGLALATQLQARKTEFALFEARDRLGGRILSVRCETARMAVDLGPAWFWPQIHPRVARLVDDLTLSAFPQSESGTVLHLSDPNSRPKPLHVESLHGGAFRIEGGAGALVSALASRIDPSRLHLSWIATAVEDRGDHLRISLRHHGEPREVQARRLVLALPPRLVAERLSFSPELAEGLKEALRQAPTWMAQQAKVVMGYERAFWRDAGLAGNALADHPQAVLGEVFDASDSQSRRAALGGFLALPPATREAFRAGLPMLVRSQMVQLFGPEAQRGEKHYQDWASEAFTCSTLDRSLPATTPRYGDPLLVAPHWSGRLLFGGTETARYGGGYMEGALEAAGRLLSQLAADTAQPSPPGAQDAPLGQA